jgi:phosphinothricin acetyltransferase
MTAQDWESVRRIYLEGLATDQASFETEAPAWEQWDRSHLEGCRLVACSGDRVLAWAALSPVSQRTCYAGVAEFSLYVGESSRGMGIGKSLLEALVVASEAQGIWTICASTFPENTVSLAVQSACGFRVVGRREHIAQHKGIWRDTILTERRSKKVGLHDERLG